MPEVTLGKRCARLDLRQSSDRAAFIELMRRADDTARPVIDAALDSIGAVPASTVPAAVLERVVPQIEQDLLQMVRFLSREGRDLQWWERFDTLVVAHCSVPWDTVLGYDDPPEEKRP